MYWFTEPELEFLYGISHVPDQTLSAYKTAGDCLESVAYKIRDSPAKLEEMQKHLKPFFALADYQQTKTFFRKNLNGRHKVFNVLLALIEEDYATAPDALQEAIPFLDKSDRNDIFVTLSVLGRQARERGDKKLSDTYDSLTKIIK